jgi:hypothetical protein
MSWIDELQRETVYQYTNRDTGETFSATKEILEEQLGVKLTCSPGDSFEHEGGVYHYAGFEPRKLGMMMKTTFEKNGRKAVRIKHGNGTQAVRSMSRDNYLKGKGTDSVLTKGCREASAKKKEEIVRQKYSAWTKGGST